MTDCSEREWLEAYEEWGRQYDEDGTAKQIYDALIASELFTVSYWKTDFQRQARFYLRHKATQELVRVTVHVRSDEKGRKEGVGVIKPREVDWPPEWVADFESEFGFVPGMGRPMANYCRKSPQHLDRFVGWLLETARGARKT